MSETPFRVEKIDAHTWIVTGPGGDSFNGGVYSHYADAKSDRDVANAAWNAAGGPALTPQRDELVTRVALLEIDLRKAGADLIDKQGKWELAKARITRLEEALKQHKHTDDCLAYAASTGKSFCIEPCNTARAAVLT